MNISLSKPAAPPYHAIIALFILCMTICSVRLYATTDIDTTRKFKPDLVILDPKKQADTAATVVINTNDSTATGDSTNINTPTIIRMFVADSAKFISPKPRTIITGNTVTCEIEPRMPVDSVKLFVRHSQNRIDTLGVIKAPPYKAVWDCGSVPDQDPAHLQFGYVLYAPGVIIVSPAMPHHWTLKRGGGRAPSKDRYSIRQQTAHKAFPLDGDRAKWDRAMSGRIGDAKRNIGEFRIIWTGARLYFTAWVNDSSITPGDFVELHLDMYSDPADFPGMTHRSLRFGPLTRSMVFIGSYTEGKGYARCDSIGQLFRDEMNWRSVVDPNGKWYTIEAAIPLSLLSGFELPPKSIGMDVTVVNVDRVTRGGNVDDLFGDDDDFDIEDDDDNTEGDDRRGGNLPPAVDSVTNADNINTGNAKPIKRIVKPIGAMIGRIEHDTSFYSWAGSTQFTRYSPSTWGTAKFTHAIVWFKVIFFILTALALISALLTILQTFITRRNEIREDKMMDEDNYSPVTTAVIECVEKGLADANFGLKDVLKSIDKKEDEVTAALQKDLEVTFDKLLLVKRIKRSQGLMKDPDLDIEKIAEMSGFANVNTYREQYKAQMNVDPKISRAAVLDRIREDKEAEEEDDDD